MKIIHNIHKYDVSLFIRLLNAKSYEIQSVIAKYISKTADGHLYFFLMLIMYALYGSQHPLLQAMFYALMLERPLYFVLKNSFKRRRPSVALQNYQSKITPSDQFSFPSGHTSAAFLVATLVSYFYPHFMLLLFVWAGLVGFSRVALGVHFPTDTLAGTALGICCAAISLEFIVV